MSDKLDDKRDQLHEILPHSVEIDRSSHPSLLVIRHESCTSLGLLAAAAQRYCKSIRYWEIAAGESLSLPELDRFSHL